MPLEVTNPENGTSLLQKMRQLHFLYLHSWITKVTSLALPTPNQMMFDHPPLNSLFFILSRRKCITLLYFLSVVSIITVSVWTHVKIYVNHSVVPKIIPTHEHLVLDWWYANKYIHIWYHFVAICLPYQSNKLFLYCVVRKCIIVFSY